MGKRRGGSSGVNETAETVPAADPSSRRWWVVGAVLFAVCGTLGASLVAHSVADREAEKSRQAFERSSHDVALTLQLALRREEDLVFAAAGFFLGTPDASSADFVGWADSVQAWGRYPELLAMGETLMVPAKDLPAFVASLPPETLAPGETFALNPPGDRPFYCLLRVSLQRDPSAGSAPPGADFCTGSTAAPLVTTRDSGESGYRVANIGSGDLLVVTAPFYRGGVVPATIDGRRESIVGWIGMALDPAVVLDVALQSHSDMSVVFEYHEGSSDVAFRRGHAADTSQSMTLDLPNSWTVQTSAKVGSSDVFAYGTAIALFAGGVALSLLLATLLYVLGTTRARALRLVVERTGQLRHQSLHDPLTDLPNRALISDRVDRLLARNRRHGTTGAALFIDLDDFKNINDTLGHQAGDRLLVAVAARLRSAIRDVDTIGRMGGDEFVVLIDGAELPIAPELVAERLIDLMRQPFELEGTPTPLTVSISVGLAIGDRESGDDLLRDADVALYQAKGAGKNRYEIFRPEMHTEISRRIGLEIDLRFAAEADQFRLVYQPIYNLDDLALVGVEALLRWDHPTLGLIEPDEFIPILEQNGQIMEVGRWVLHEACMQMAAWHLKGDTLDISVNVSGRQLDHDAIVDHIRDALTSSGLDATSLIIEVTETALMSNAARTAARLIAIKQLGVRIAVDDFGTGYSSLAYLQQFPVDCLKIDRRFTSAISISPESTALINTLVQLGKDLGLQTLAEGIETAGQMDHLRGQRIDQVQGFLLSRPLTPGNLETRLLAPRRPDALVPAPTAPRHSGS